MYTVEVHGDNPVYLKVNPSGNKVVLWNHIFFGIWCLGADREPEKHNREKFQLCPTAPCPEMQKGITTSYVCYLFFVGSIFFTLLQDECTIILCVIFWNNSLDSHLISANTLNIYSFL